jgi:hypothetical protein
MQLSSIATLLLSWGSLCSGSVVELASSLNADDVCVGSQCAVEALQTSSRVLSEIIPWLPAQKQNASLVFDKHCNMSRPDDDYSRPIETVLSEHHEFDVPGYGHGARCYFGRLSAPVRACSGAYQNSNFEMYTSWKNHKEAKPASVPLKIQYGDRTIHTYNHKDALADATCDALGWLDLPKEKVSTFASFEEMVNSECAALLKEHPDVSMVSVNGISDMRGSVGVPEEGADVWMLTADKSWFRKQAAAQCLLGTVGCDMAHCAINRCRVQSKDKVNLIGQGSQCSPKA